MTFLSMRRAYLDVSLMHHSHHFEGRVLDLGGKKKGRRGEFEPPFDRVNDWVYLNSDEASNPDILATVPPIPCDDESFDLVLSTEVMEYLVDPTAFLKEAARVLKPKGKIILSVPFLHLLHKDYEHDYWRFTETSLKALLEKDFDSLFFERQGGLLAVFYDLYRGYHASSASYPPPLRTRVLLKILRGFGPLCFKIDKYMFKNRFFINTGFFFVGLKK